MRYFIGFLITIGLIILLIIMLFKGDGNKPKVPKSSKSLDSYSTTNAEVTMTIGGPIVAESEHREVKVTVGRDNVTFEEIHGYKGDVANRRTFDNNEASYRSFLRALGFAGFTQGNTDKALADETGRCPTGLRYVFEMTLDGENLERFWDTSCGGVKTYNGVTNVTLQLFQAQVPDYSNLTADLRF